MTTVGWQESYDVPPRGDRPYSRGTGGSFDMVQFVNRVADQFERQTGVRVEQSARAALIRPATPHVEDVQRALEAGTITLDFLEESLMTVLRNAHRLAGQRMVGGLDAPAMEIAMRHYCPYLFWC